MLEKGNTRMGTHAIGSVGRASLVMLSLTTLAGAGVAQAGYTTSFGVENHFVDPVSWNIGDLNSTYNEWDAKSAAIGNTPDHGTTTNPAGLTDATLDVKSPGFRSGTGVFYSFSNHYGATADIYNHGGTSGAGTYNATYGTHVIIQTGSSQNPDLQAGFTELVTGHGFGNFWDSMKIVELNGSSIAGGDNASALQISEISFTESAPSAFGPADVQELIYEFWLPGYTGDFRVDWDQTVHAAIDTLRVDSIIAVQDVGGTTPFALTVIPEPASLALLALGSLAMFSRRREI